MTPTGPDQRDCAECGKPIGNRPRVTLADRRVVCVPCHQKISRQESQMRVWELYNGECDWVAARTKDEAFETLRRHHGLSAAELAEYTRVEPVPDNTEFKTDEVDVETEEPVTRTAVQLVAGKTKPFVLGSTYT